jgi:hypothetical protein
MKKLAAMFLIIGLGYFFIFRSIKNNPEPIRPPPIVLEVNPEQKFGEAGELVRSFFRAWENGDYAAMYEFTAKEIDFLEFYRKINWSPVHWRELRIILETKNSAYSMVKLSVAVTDLPSLFAATVLNYQFHQREVTTGSSFGETPAEYGIEQFTTIVQTWTVVSEGGRMAIEIYPRHGTFGAGTTNIVNYVMDAGEVYLPRTRDLFPEINKRTKLLLATSEWTIALERDLGFSMGETANEMEKATPLVEQGLQNRLRGLNE